MTRDWMDEFYIPEGTWEAILKASLKFKKAKEKPKAIPPRFLTVSDFKDLNNFMEYSKKHDRMIGSAKVFTKVNELWAEDVEFVEVYYMDFEAAEARAQKLE